MNIGKIALGLLIITAYKINYHEIPFCCISVGKEKEKMRLSFTDDQSINKTKALRLLW